MASQFIDLPVVAGGTGAVDSVNGLIGVVVLTKSNVGLGNVNNTSDANKPVSTAQQTALDLKRNIDFNKSFSPNAGAGYFTMDSDYMAINPIANSPSETYAMDSKFLEIDLDADGFSFGTGGNAAMILNMNYKHIGKSNTGSLTFINTSSDIGNGTDAISIGGMGLIFGFTNIDANVTMTGPLQGYGFQYNMDAASTMNSYINAFYDFSNIGTACGSYQSFACGPTIASIKNNSGYAAFNCNTQIPVFTGNANFTGLAISPTLGTFDTGNFQGISINPTITSVVNANGIYVNMTNVTASGTKYAGYFDGDVNITGSLTFGGALSIGKLSAFDAENLVDGGGNPSTIHGLITSVTAPNGVTTLNYDYLGVNTASLFTAEANSTNTAGPLQLGACSLGLPMVITTQTGSLTDVVCGAVFALSMDAGSTGGTITQAIGGRSVCIPNGVTTIDRHYGWYADCPFGTIATDNWGIYQKDAEHNFFGGNVKIGAGGDTPTATMALDVGGDTYLAGAVTIGVGGSALTNVLTGSATLDFPSTGPNSGSDLTVTITGAIVGNPVHIGVVTDSMNLDDDLTYFGWVSAADTVTVRMLNTGGGTHNPTAQPFKILITQF